MMNFPQAPAAQTGTDQDKRMQQMLALGLMQAATAQNPTTSKKAGMVNGLSQALAGGLGAYMAGGRMGGLLGGANKFDPLSGANGLLMGNRGSGD